jgi:hypothetical protein
MCLNILYCNTMKRGSKDITKLKSDNIMIQLGYNAIALHENILLSWLSQSSRRWHLGAQLFLLSFTGNLVTNWSTTTCRRIWWGRNSGPAWLIWSRPDWPCCSSGSAWTGGSDCKATMACKDATWTSTSSTCCCVSAMFCNSVSLSI